MKAIIKKEDRTCTIPLAEYDEMTATMLRQSDALNEAFEVYDKSMVWRNFSYNKKDEAFDNLKIKLELLRKENEELKQRTWHDLLAKSINNLLYGRR